MKNQSILLYSSNWFVKQFCQRFVICRHYCRFHCRIFSRYFTVFTFLFAFSAYSAKDKEYCVMSFPVEEPILRVN